MHIVRVEHRQKVICDQSKRAILPMYFVVANKHSNPLKRSDQTESFHQSKLAFKNTLESRPTCDVINAVLPTSW